MTARDSPLPKWMRPAREPAFRWTWREAAGGLGDLGTFLPLALLLATQCGMDFGRILVLAGLMNVASGWFFRQPVPVQPMKALAAVAVAQGLSQGAVAAAGLAMGAVLLLLAVCGVVGWIQRWVPRSVVAGLQLGVGVKLTWAAFGPGALGDAGTWGPGMWGLLLACAAITALGLARGWPTLLAVVGLGLAVAGFARGAPPWSVPSFHVVWPRAGDWSEGVLEAALPQLPLTILNSVVAVCALSGDLYPGRGISPRSMAASVGLMNLVAVPLGGMPMCHGSGGLAAQYQFGARTGGSVILLGLGKILAGIAFGAGLAGWLDAFPAPVLGLLILLAGGSLTWAGRHGTSRGTAAVALSCAAAIVALGTLAGFGVGMALALVSSTAAPRGTPPPA